jgi:hypothetical protein
MTRLSTYQRDKLLIHTRLTLTVLIQDVEGTVAAVSGHCTRIPSTLASVVTLDLRSYLNATRLM